MDIKLDYDFTKGLLTMLREDEFFNVFRTIYSRLDLYDMSLDWQNSKMYILKFRGTNGDLVIYWN